MPKYYVSSGSMKQVVTADDPMAALKLAVLKEMKKRAGKEFCFGRIAVISERGFDRTEGYKDELLHLWKQEFFEELGLSASFPKEYP